jgi:hypothetical protein
MQIQLFLRGGFFCVTAVVHWRVCVCVLRAGAYACVCWVCVGWVGRSGGGVGSSVESLSSFLVGHVLPDGALLSLTASGNPVTLLSDVK